MKNDSYKDVVPKEHELLCILDDTKFKNAHDRNRHIKEVYGLTYEQYIMQNYFNNEYPECKCGKCHNKMKFYHSPFGIWFHDYTTNHFPRIPHREDSKIKMKETCIKTMLKRYGVTNPMYLQSTIDKIGETKERNHGDKNYNNPMKNQETKERNHNDKNYNNKEQAKKTNQKRYHDKTFTATIEGKAQVKETCIKNLGVDNPMKSEKIKQKLFQNNIDKTGYKSNLEDPEFRRKYNNKTSKIEKYICECINAESKFIYKHYEYDMKVGNDVFEIEGDFYHPIKIENLTLIQLGALINDYKKIQLMKDSQYTLYKILQSNLSKNITIKNLKEKSHMPDYSIKYNDIIINKEYLFNYIQKRGKNKLNRFIRLTLKFIRIFQPTFPNKDIKDENIINGWFDDEKLMNVIEYIIGINEENVILDLSLKEIIQQLSK